MVPDVLNFSQTRSHLEIYVILKQCFLRCLLSVHGKCKYISLAKYRPAVSGFKKITLKDKRQKFTIVILDFGFAHGLLSFAQFNLFTFNVKIPINCICILYMIFFIDMFCNIQFRKSTVLLFLWNYC